MLQNDKKSKLYFEIFQTTNKELSDAFSDVREEFEEHLSSINQNTNEIQGNHEFLANLDQKISKVEDRLDLLTMFLQKAGMDVQPEAEFKPVKLSKREQEIFLVIYTQEEAKGALTYLDIAHFTGLPEDLVADYMSNMIAKGVPIKKRYISNQAYFSLNPQFKSLQAKQNVLGIEQTTLAI